MMYVVITILIIYLAFSLYTNTKLTKRESEWIDEQEFLQRNYKINAED